MKQKERKTLAQKIAKQQKIINTSSDKKAIKLAEQEIIRLSGCVQSMDDIIAIDELIQQMI